MKRLFAMSTFALVAAISLVGPATVNADYPPGGGTVTTKDSGSSVEVTVTGFKACAGTLVTITITPPGGGAPLVFKKIADVNGKVVVVVPDATAKGTWNVVATAPPCQGVQGSFGHVLPRTGTDTRTWVLPTVVVVITGLGLLLVARRRHQHHAAT